MIIKLQKDLFSGYYDCLLLDDYDNKFQIRNHSINLVYSQVKKYIYLYECLEKIESCISIKNILSIINNINDINIIRVVSNIKLNNNLLTDFDFWFDFNVEVRNIRVKLKHYSYKRCELLLYINLFLQDKSNFK